MKRLFSRIVLSISALCLFAGMQMNALAAGTVTYDGNAKEFIFGPGSSHSPTDLFPDFKEVMPGDSFTQEIVVKNSENTGCNVRIYLKSTGATTETEEFLSKLRLTVAQIEGSTLYEGPADEAGDLNEWVCLGTISPGAEVKLEVTLNVPIELDDTYQDVVGYVDWQFKVEEIPNGGGHNPVPTQTPDPTVTAPPRSPQTGDTLQLGWYIVLAAVSGLGIAATILVFVTKSREEEK